MAFTLGGVSLPIETVATPQIRDIENKRRTFGGTLKTDWRAQKTDFTLSVPNIRASYFSTLKALKAAHANVSYVYPNESGSGDITKTVRIGLMSYDSILYTSEPVVQGLIIPLEEI